ncbi:unnamed protein product [Prunus armeniaca]
MAGIFLIYEHVGLSLHFRKLKHLPLLKFNTPHDVRINAPANYMIGKQSENGSEDEIERDDKRGG